MTVWTRVMVPILNATVPPSLRSLVRRALPMPPKKEDCELAFWLRMYTEGGGAFDNADYRRLLLGMAGEDDDGFLEGRVVADFGCGPQGSLAWAAPARMRIGIDLLANRYADAFPGAVRSHGMIYLTATEAAIPLPPASVDVMFTLNALDHVADFPRMCREILRVLKPGGDFIGGFNLGEPPTPLEPQQLTEEAIRVNLLDALDLVSYRTIGQGPDQYEPFFTGGRPYEPGGRGYLWARGRKKAEAGE